MEAVHPSRPADLRAKHWVVKPEVSADVLDALPGIHPVLAQVLYNRNLRTPADIQSFLERRYLESDDPFLLTDMDKAVGRIRQAIEADEMIVIYGDFDADGVTSTVLLTEALRGLGLRRSKARPYIPDRIDEGYGLNKDALTTIKDEIGASLVITVDCGIRSVDEVDHANALGLDMIITDHHSIGAKLPPALAVINPKRAESAYPEKMLAGVGIAYKLAQALYQAMPDRVAFDLRRLLDLVAIGTVADLAPLLGENRQLVIEGLQQLNTLNRPGVTALAEVANLKGGQISAENIAFGIGPRINAAGRLAHAYDAARLLAAPDRTSARGFANTLESLNRQRQKKTEEQTTTAAAMIDEDAPILIAVGDSFDPGIVGLIASRLSERHHRPTIVLEQGEDESRASCRSIDQFHITKALEQVSDLLERYGGHAAAAGLTIKNENLPEFRERMTTIAAEAFEGKELLPSLEIDAEVQFDQVDWALHESLAQLEPTGEANRKPIFMSRNLQVINHRVVGKDGTHLQIELSDGMRGFKCIAFRQGSWAEMMPRRVDAVYALDVNEWRGRRTLQLQIQDLRVAAS